MEREHVRVGASSGIRLVAVVFTLLAQTLGLLGQGGYQDDRVMIQGFEWESHQSGKQRAEGGYEYQVDWTEKWYANVAAKVDALANAEIDLIWLPPPSQGEGAGYHPQALYDMDNNYGTEAEHRQLLKALLQKGIEPIADIVVNHRTGTGGWVTFKNPDWPAQYICANDEFWFQNKNSLGSADAQILEQSKRGAPDYANSDWPGWDGSRDLDHTNSNLRTDVKKYLKRLREYGYRGWRYDMVKGFDPSYIAEYNFDSKPTFAVGEYLLDKVDTLAWWVDGTKQWGQPDPAEHACSAFDFATWHYLQEFIKSGAYNRLPAVSFKDGIDDGLIAVNKDKAVTFLENHDSGFPQKKFDSFPNNEKLMQGYAYILTHPGVPCIYWKHFFDWNHGSEIAALVKARKYAGVTSGSFIKTEVHGNDYVAIVGDKPTASETLIVKIGHGIAFQPDLNVWSMETFGNGYAVWVRKTKKAETEERVDATKAGFPVPN